MKIQRFASFWDEMTAMDKQSIEEEKKKLAANETEKTNLLNDYNKNYNQQLSDYNNLLEQQQKNIDTAAQTQKETQQKQTDYNIGLINQNKQEAQKKTDSELGNAYIDYQKGLNQFGGTYETLASQGLAGTGFGKNSEIAMNITYQNRVGTAKAALQKANTDYDNQIQQALLNNDAALAEIALKQMQDSYQIALQGFEYKNTLYNNKLAYEKDINNTYFNRNQALNENIRYYEEQISQNNRYKQEEEEAERQYQLQLQKMQQEYAQWQAEFNAAYSGGGYGGGDYYNYSDNGTGGKTSEASASEQSIASSVFGNNSKTFAKKDYYFSNGYQPRYVNNQKLSDTGVNVNQVFGSKFGSKVGGQNIWYANGNYYIWLGNGNRGGEYMRVDNEYVSKIKKASNWWNDIWHKGV